MNQRGQNRGEDRIFSPPLRDEWLKLSMEQVYRHLQCVAAVQQAELAERMRRLHACVSYEATGEGSDS